MTRFLSSIALAALTLFHASMVDAQQFTSPVEQVPLIELYTSEGCSSCPPADRWLSSLKEDDGLWSRFVPAAFHVDYWDYIGWKDRFASREYSQRQRRYAHEFQEPTVYTPGMRKAGEEWRRWRLFGTPEVDNAASVGVLEMQVQSDGSFTAQFTPVDNDNDPSLKHNKSWQLTVALLGQNLVSQVSRGENRGRELKHDFVVLGMTTLANEAGLSAQEQPGKPQWVGQLPTAQVESMDYAVAAWVTQGGSLRPLQAVGGDLQQGFRANPDGLGE